MSVDADITIRRETFTASITRPANTTAYASGQVLAAVNTDALFTLGTTDDTWTHKVTRPGKGTGMVESLQVHSSIAGAKADAELWIFNTTIAPVADGAAFNPSDAEALTRVMVVELPAYLWKTGGANASLEIANLDRPFTAKDGKLYAQLVWKGAYTPTASEVFTLSTNISKD